MDLKSLLERLEKRERNIIWACVLKIYEGQPYKIYVPIRITARTA